MRTAASTPALDHKRRLQQIAIPVERAGERERECVCVRVHGFIADAAEKLNHVHALIGVVADVFDHVAQRCAPCDGEEHAVFEKRFEVDCGRRAYVLLALLERVAAGATITCRMPKRSSILLASSIPNEEISSMRIRTMPEEMEALSRRETVGREHAPAAQFLPASGLLNR